MKFFALNIKFLERKRKSKRIINNDCVKIQLAINNTN